MSYVQSIDLYGYFEYPVSIAVRYPHSAVCINHGCRFDKFYGEPDTADNLAVLGIDPDQLGGIAFFVDVCAGITAYYPDLLTIGRYADRGWDRRIESAEDGAVRRGYPVNFSGAGIGSPQVFSVKRESSWRIAGGGEYFMNCVFIVVF
ncbi:MAG: hypothetical protein A4E66_02116 [Syntrophus sp. PtaB.Bin001]|nr:MAG: hypothetical protein A4E66_02116 [Syntrophus sp. PtaB.Bin001]